jgi:hypothetical protein
VPQCRGEGGSSCRPRDQVAWGVASLRRWVVARLGSPDLPFFHEEIDASDESEFVREFVVAARS